MTKIINKSAIATVIAASAALVVALSLSACSSAAAVQKSSTDTQPVMEAVEKQYSSYLFAKSFSYDTPSVQDDGTVANAKAQLIVEAVVAGDEPREMSYAVLDKDGNEIGRVSGTLNAGEQKASYILEGDIPADRAADVVKLKLLDNTADDQAMSEQSSELSEQIQSAAASWQEMKDNAEKEAADAKAAAEAAKASSGATGVPTYTGGGTYGDVLMVGDSIMVVSSWSLKDTLPGVTIDAVSGRSLETGGPGEGSGSQDGVLDHVRACDRSFSRYVIGTGNNDGYGMDMESAEEIVSLLPGKQIWFVTEYVSNNSAGTSNTNSTIDAMCAKYPNVHKADWYSVVTANEAAFLQGDNCHPMTREATDAYAAVIANALQSV